MCCRSSANGEKRTEYREVKPYWTQRIGKWVGDNTPRFILFQIGYKKNGPRLLVQTTGIDIGPCPYPGWSGDYYRIRFEVVQPYIRARGIYFPIMEMPKMKEEGCAKVRDTAAITEARLRMEEMKGAIEKIIARMEKMGDEFIEEGRHAFKSDCVGLILYGFCRELCKALTTNHEPPTTN